jgi:hypothetical protein
MRLEIRYQPFDPTQVSTRIYRDGVLVATRTTTVAEAEALAERFDEQGLTVERLHNWDALAMQDEILSQN